MPGGGVVRMAGGAWHEKPQEAQTPDSNGGEAPKGNHDRGGGQGRPTFCVAHGGEDGSSFAIIVDHVFCLAGVLRS